VVKKSTKSDHNIGPREEVLYQGLTLCDTYVFTHVYACQIVSRFPLMIPIFAEFFTSSMQMGTIKKYISFQVKPHGKSKFTVF
jgi:hypothetical protein